MRTSPWVLLLAVCRTYDERRARVSTGIPRLASRRGPSSCRDTRLAALEREQAPLGRESSGVPTEAPVGRDHAMTGHHDRDRIRAKRAACRARRLLITRLARHGSVGGDLAVRHARRCREDAALERG